MGTIHKKALDTRYALACLFKQKFMAQDAAKHFQLVEQGPRKPPGPEHPETVDASSRLKHRSNVDIDGDPNDGDVGSNDGSVGLMVVDTVRRLGDNFMRQ